VGVAASSSPPQEAKANAASTSHTPTAVTRTPFNEHRPLTGGDLSHTGPVGLNPFRQQHRSPADVVMVVAAFAVLVGLVAWAMFG
jgi:hypothetical protein